jgi:ABC-type glutathione transport system ATPase component
VLVCDEVTSALDGDKKQELLHALDRVQNEHATTVVLISHDLPLVAQVSDRVAMIEDGRLRLIAAGRGGHSLPICNFFRFP